MNKVVIFDTAMVSENKGDDIIMESCNNIIDEMFPDSMILRLPTHNKLSREAYRISKNADYEIVCGTNLLSGTFSPWFRTWEIGLKDTRYFQNVCLMGVGWWKYQDKNTAYAIKLWNKLLSKDLLHSVRDSYTEQKMRAMGFSNVINTSCPTMWKLTPEFCRRIPCEKKNKVITTLTCYHPDVEKDRKFISILLTEYQEVYFWIQNTDDYLYLKNVGLTDRVSIIPPSLNALDCALRDDDVEYCGTRLHAGIRALNAGKRSIIIANDNRAKEIARDTGLKIVEIDKIEEKLAGEINSTFSTQIKLPMENIIRWKGQFKGR